MDQASNAQDRRPLRSEKDSMHVYGQCRHPPGVSPTSEQRNDLRCEQETEHSSQDQSAVHNEHQIPVSTQSSEARRQQQNDKSEHDQQRYAHSAIDHNAGHAARAQPRCCASAAPTAESAASPSRPRVQPSPSPAAESRRKLDSTRSAARRTKNSRRSRAVWLQRSQPSALRRATGAGSQSR